MHCCQPMNAVEHTAVWPLLSSLALQIVPCTVAGGWEMVQKWSLGSGHRTDAAFVERQIQYQMILDFICKGISTGLSQPLQIGNPMMGTIQSAVTITYFVALLCNE